MNSLSESRLSTQPKPAGRRRDSSKHQAILKATRELLTENHFRGLSLKSIASRAKVTRNVLYNWWDGDINRIVEDAVLPKVSEWTIPNTGTFRGDIDVFLDLTIDALHKPNILKGLLALAAEITCDDNELHETTRYFRAPSGRLLTKIIKNAEARNEIAHDLNPNHISQIISGSLIQFAISKKIGRRKSKAILLELITKLAAK